MALLRVPLRSRVCSTSSKEWSVARVVAARSRGLWSRRAADKLIKAGRVSVEGEVVTDQSARLDVLDPSVAIDGISLAPRGRTRIWRAHKLRGELVTDEDPQNRPTMAQRFRMMGVTHEPAVLEQARRAAHTSGGSDRARRGDSSLMSRLTPIGRLDFNSEGLMLFTSCPLLATRMEAPSGKVERTYAVKVRGRLQWPWLRSLRAGKTIDGVRYGPIEVSPLRAPPRSVRLRRGRRTRPPAHERQRERRGSDGGGSASDGGKQHWVKVALKEGKNREIRNVMASMNLHVLHLSRTEFGPVALEGLPAGSVMELSASKVRALLKNLGVEEILE